MIEKNTCQGNESSQGNESYHKTPTEEDLPQPLWHFVRTPTKVNFNKTSEVETGTQTNFIHNNIYVKNDVFEAFYEDYLEYKGYVNDILNTLIRKDDMEHSKNYGNIVKKSNHYKIK